jgi:alkylation response protein AidB-like acyl-CoA dehydrogenase
MYLELNKNLTEQEQQVKTETHRFAAEVLRPASMELDKMHDPADVIGEGSPLWDVFRQAYRLGYHNAHMAEDLGGAGMSPLGRHIFMEEMGWGAADFAVGIGVTGMPFSFAAFGRNERMLAEIVTPFVNDRDARYVGCWAITEPQHGSDMLGVGTPTFKDPAAAASLRAVLDGDEYVINGQKSAWVSNGTIATHAACFLGLEPEKGQEGGGVAIIPLTLPGVTKGKPLNKLGQRALNQGEIFFDNVRIPKQYMLAQGPMYNYVIDATMAGANAFMGATFTGLARAAFEEGMTYAKGRVQGGKVIAEHQAVQLKLANMFINVEAARQLSRAAIAYNSTTSPPATQYSMASKVFCTQTAFMVASDALQLHGGYGLAKEMLIEKLFRDARSSLIEDGTNDVMSLTAINKVLQSYVP